VENGLRFVRERRVDALIVPGVLCGAAELALLESADVPVVLAQFEGRTSLPVVRLDDGSGVRALVEHLVGLGHRELLWVGPAGDGSYTRHRRAAFRQAVATHGVAGHELDLDQAPTNCPMPDAGSLNAARRAMQGLLASESRPAFTAVMCCREITALGVYAALAEAGLRIPDDISVSGYDDVLAETAWPPMTVASHMLGEIGSAAARLVMQASEEGGMGALRGHVEEIESRIVVRASTASPASASL
jgi:LacI family transcriptional regulator